MAPDAERLGELKRAAVSAEWELAPGATTTDDALAQLEDSRAHLMVVSGKFDGLLAAARTRYPGLRVVSDVEAPEVDTVIDSFDQVRGAIKAAPKPGGPVRTPGADATS